MFTTEELEKKVREIAAERPDVKYQSAITGRHDMCFYTRGECTDGSIGCIIGQAMVALGYSPEEVRPMTIGDVLSDLGLPRSRFLRRVQELQDRGEPWAYAVCYADKPVVRIA